MRENASCDTVDAPDGLPATVVSSWTSDKHDLLREYLKLQAGPRTGWIGPGKAGATYIDLFCGAGKSFEKSSRKYVDGSPVVAWLASQQQGQPFTEIYIADSNRKLRDACAERLGKLGAPVRVVDGTATTAVDEVVRSLNPWGLHFAFLDPFNIGGLELSILTKLGTLKRMDVLVHISAMDVRRNFERNLAGELNDFEGFAPSWQSHVPAKSPRDDQYRALIDYWKSMVDKIGLDTATKFHPMKNSTQVIYWLLLLYKNNLAERFWKIVLKYKSNQTLDMFDNSG